MKSIALFMYYMECGGVEMALVNFLRKIDPLQFHIDLYLVEAKGDFMNIIPKYVTIKCLKMSDTEKELVISRQIRHTIKYGIRKKRIVETISLGCKYALNKIRKCNFPEYKTVFSDKVGLFPTYDYVLDFHGYLSLTTYLAAYVFRGRSKSTWIHCEGWIDKVVDYRDTFSKFDRIFAVSHTCSDKFNNILGGNRAEVFYNFINQDDIIKQSQVNLPIPVKKESGYIFTTVGRLCVQKGFDLAIKVARIIKDNNIHFTWFFCGDGSEMEALKKMVSDYKLTDEIVFVGYTSNPYCFINSCDIYIQSSRYEGYAVTLMEAVVLKKVIVTTNVSGSEEAVKDGVNGYVTSHDAKEIAGKIIQLLSNRSKLEQMKFHAASRILVQKESEGLLKELLIP